MAKSGIALEAEQRRRLLFGKTNHLRRLGAGLRRLELRRIDAKHLLMAPLARGLAARRRRPEGLQVDIVDPRLLQSGGEDVLREARLARQGHGADVEHLRDSRGP